MNKDYFPKHFGYNSINMDVVFKMVESMPDTYIVEFSGHEDRLEQMTKEGNFPDAQKVIEKIMR